jgi:hypothetical protein
MRRTSPAARISRPIAGSTTAREEPDSGNGGGDAEGDAPRTAVLVTAGAAATAVVDATDVGIAGNSVDVTSWGAVAGGAAVVGAVTIAGRVVSATVVRGGAVVSGTVVRGGAVVVVVTVVRGGAVVVVRGGSHRLATDRIEPVRAPSAVVDCRRPAAPQA